MSYSFIGSEAVQFVVEKLRDLDLVQVTIDDH